MNAQFALKTLGLATLTAMSLATAAAQAGHGFVRAHFGTDNPYLVANHAGPGHPSSYGRAEHGPYREHILGKLERRQAMQRARIDHGVTQGDITRREAAKLYREQEEIDQMQRYFLADGQLSRGEYVYLDEALDQASRNIRHQAHDNEWRW